MSELLQSAQHPDADQLTAFAEHALPAHEQEQTLAHLATCSACRQLVFLAQAEEPVQVVQPVAVKKPWFSGWNLLWPAVAALAGIIAVSVHLRHMTAGTVQPTKVAIVTETPPIPAAPPLAPSVAPSVVAATPRPMPRAVAKADAAPIASTSATSINGGMQQGVTVQAQDQSSIGFTRSRDKAPAVTLHGPMINQQQQMLGAAASPVPAQKFAQAPVSVAQGAPAAVAGAMGMAGGTGSGPRPAAPPVAVTLGETVRAAAMAAPAPAAPKPAPQAATQRAAQTVTVDALSDSAAAISLDTALATGAMPIPELPSGQSMVSKVSNGSRTVALDAEGAVFVSKDDGKHWTAVKAQWPGRAVQVSLNGAIAPIVAGRNTYTLALRSARGLSIAHNALPDGTRAQIVGSVTDPSGASIPGATIRVKNAAGAYVSTVRADVGGGFATGPVDPGKYSVEISMPGFATFVQTLELQARDRASLGAALQVGSESTTVTVSNGELEFDSKPKPEPFTLITDAGVRWTSSDGQKWKRQ